MRLDRRHFLATAAAPVVLPSIAGLSQSRRQSAPPAVDPMLLHFDREARRIYADVANEKASPATFASLESLFRTQAVYFAANGVDDLIKQAIRTHKRRAIDDTFTGKHKAHMQHEMRRRYPELQPSKRSLPEPTFEQLTAVADRLEAEGISKRFERLADGMRAFSKRPSGAVQVQDIGGWIQAQCAWLQSANELDAALITMVCSLSVFFPWLIYICGLWGFELGVLMTVEWFFC